MQSFLSSVFSEMSSRMKNPLLGTFVLSWLAYNHDHVAKLLFSDNTQRIALIESTSFNLESDLFTPLGLALVYLFVVPLAQWGIDIVKYGLVDKRRTATHHKHLHEKYIGQAKIAQQQSKASLEYWQELHRNRAEDAGRQIIQLKETVSHLKKLQLELENQISMNNRNYSTLEGSNKKISDEHHSLINSHNDARQKLEILEENYISLMGLVEGVVNNLGSNDLKWLSEGIQGLDIAKSVQIEREKLADLAAPKQDKRLDNQISASLNQLQSQLEVYQSKVATKCAVLDKIIAETVDPLVKALGINND